MPRGCLSQPHPWVPLHPELSEAASRDDSSPRSGGNALRGDRALGREQMGEEEPGLEMLGAAWAPIWALPTRGHHPEAPVGCWLPPLGCLPRPQQETHVYCEDKPQPQAPSLQVAWGTSSKSVGAVAALAEGAEVGTGAVTERDTPGPGGQREPRAAGILTARGDPAGSSPQLQMEVMFLVPQWRVPDPERRPRAWSELGSGCLQRSCCSFMS